MTKGLGDPSVVTFAGFDARHVNRLPLEEGQTLVLIAALALVSSVAAGLSTAWVAWLSFGQVPLAVAAGGLGAGFVLVLHRLVFAGAGAAPHIPSTEEAPWRPGWASLAVMGLLGVLLAQPLALLCRKARLDGEVVAARDRLYDLRATSLRAAIRAERDALAEAVLRAEGERQELVLRREKAASDEPGPGQVAELDALRQAQQQNASRLSQLRAGQLALVERAESVERQLANYRAVLDEAGFLMFQLRIHWQEPGLASVLTVVWALVLASSMALRRFRANAMWLYEKEVLRESRRLIEGYASTAKAAAERTLNRWPGFSGMLTQHYADAPYNTVVAPRTVPGRVVVDRGGAVLALLPLAEERTGVTR